MFRLASPYPKIILTAYLLAITMAIAACGDFQDPGREQSGAVTPTSEAEFVNATALQQSLAAEVNPQMLPNTTPSSSDATQNVQPAGTSPDVRTVTLSWEPSLGAVGYKVYLRSALSTEGLTIDTGMATELKQRLRTGFYGFSVTAYNTHGESSQPPFVFFYVSPGTIFSAN